MNRRIKSRLADGFSSTVKSTLYEHTTREAYKQLSRQASRVLPVNFKGIPEELQWVPQWIVWKYGSNNKRPIISPRTGQVASVTDPDTWGTFQEAMNKKLSGLYHGVGLVLTEELGITGIDIDHCVSPSGAFTQEATNIIAALASYSELSPSGKGVHILLHGKPPGDRKRGSIEIYNTGRYLAFTGHRLDGVPLGLEYRQAELDQLYHSQFPQALQTSLPFHAHGEAVRVAQSRYPAKSDNEVIEKMLAARNAWKSGPLWRGEWEGRYPSQSEADRQLIVYLLYWTGNNEEQTDRLFRRSGLYRDKWDELRGSMTYGKATIANARRAQG